MGVDPCRLMQTGIDLEFGDGVYSFKLGLAQIKVLQDKCAIGIGGLYTRLLRGRYVTAETSFGITNEADFRIEDIVEVIRQGLIGGARGEVDGVAVEVTPMAANRLIDAYVLPRPLKDGWNVAAACMMALIEGYEPKKAEPAPAPATATSRAASTRRRRSPTAP